ncbi:MAG: type II toxin-antitoxin system RelE/ParE family toxin [Bacteroidota bacterium]
MANYILTNRAVADLTDIWEYTLVVWSERQADKYYVEIISAIEEIALCPSIGKEYSNVLSGVFGYRVGRHVIFYREFDSIEIEVIRVLHSMMDIDAHLNDSI